MANHHRSDERYEYAPVGLDDRQTRYQSRAQAARLARGYAIQSEFFKQALVAVAWLGDPDVRWE